MKKSSYEKIFPIQEIGEGKLINHEDVISIAYRVTYPELFLMDKSYYNSIQDKLRNFIRLLPDFAIYQTLSLYDEERYEPEYNKITNFLMRSNALYYLGRAIPLEKQYIIVSYPKKLLSKGVQSNSVIKGINPFKKNPYLEYNKDLEKIKTQIENVEISLISLFEKKNVKRLNDDELAQMLYEYSSLEYSSTNEKNKRLPTINFENNTLGTYLLGVLSIYEGKKAKSFNTAPLTSPGSVKSKVKVVSKPGDIAQSQIFPLTAGLPFKHAYSTIIQKIPKESLKMEFEIAERSLKLPADFGYASAKNKLADIELYKELIEDLDYTPVNISMSIIIPEKNKELLNMKIEATKLACSGIFEMKAIEEKEESGLVFFSHMPGNASSSYKNQKTTAYHAVSYLPKESHYKSDKRGYPFTDRFGNKVLIDIHNNPHMTNKNGVIIGPSGRGKSFLLNFIVSLIYSDAHLVIIDKGGSYKNIVNLLNGNYYDSGDKEIFRFNLFICEQDKRGKYTPDDLQISYVLSIILYIWKEGEKAKSEEKTILQDIIELYYDFVNKEKTNPTLIGFDAFIKEERRKLKEDDDKTKTSALDTKYEKYFDYDSLELMLKPYVTGKEKELLNNEENIDLTYEKLTVFDMAAIEKSNPTKFSLLCLIITFLNIKKIQKLPRSIFKSFIIDEALSFLKGDIGDFIGNLFAEVRKENGQVLIVAQGINFILEASSEVKEKIFSNRDFIAMTNHEGYENVFPDYAKLLGFTEKDIELLEAVKRNEEVFIRLGNHGMILRIEVSEEEYGVFTTDPTDMKEIAELEKKYNSMQTAIEVFAANKRLEKK